MSYVSIPGVPDQIKSGTKLAVAPRGRKLLAVTIGSAAGLLAVIAGIVIFLSPVPVLTSAPKLDLIVDTTVFLISLSVAILALGRYPLLRAPVSYWIGLGFLGYALITLIRYVLFASTLIGDTPVQEISADLINVYLWYSLFSISMPTIFLLAGVLLPWPSGRALEGRRLLGSILILLLGSVLVLLAMMAFPHAVPTLYVPQKGVVSPLLSQFDVVLIVLFWVGAALSMRRYLQTGDNLVGYVGLVQVIFGIQMLTALLSSQQYDLLWYMQRGLTIGGFLSLMFGLMAEYMNGFKRERESEARYRQLANAMPQLVWTARPDGVNDYYNQRYEEYSDIYPGQDNEWHSTAAVHPDDHGQVISRWQQSVRTESPFQMECRIKMANGEYRWHLVRAVLIRDEAGKPVKWFGTSTDIHDLKEAKDALHRYAAELERSNRDLQDFAFVASHDLQEPLRKIEAFGDAILDQPANLTERQREYLIRMRKSAERMRHMVDGLLQLSRLSTHARKFEPVDLHAVVYETLTDLELQIQQSEAVVEVGELPVVFGDPLQMRRLMQNLIGNALKFQPPGAQPFVKVYSRRAEPGRAEICIQDNGIGFNDEYAEQVFQPFRRLVGRAEFEGSGIGLAICRKIVERHNGTIAVHSREGEGATFVINLPIYDGTHFRGPQQTGAVYLPEKKPAYGDETFILDR